MKLKPNIIIILLIAIIISSILPIIYFYRDKKIKEIPEHISYNMMLDSLSKKVKKSASENKCNGFIISIREVKNNIPYISTLRTDMNLVLASYKKWNLKADKNIQQEMKKRFEEKIEKWGSLLTGNELMRMLKQQQKALPNYSSKLKIERIDNPETINDRKIYIYVYNEKTGSEIINVSCNFIHPATMQEFIKLKNKEKEELTKLKKSANLSIKIMAGIFVIFIGYLFVFLVILVKNRIQNKNKKNFLLQEIQKRENLVENGHFVAVLELVTKYLTLFPDDTEIQAFKERLLDFTNNDPKKAQQAFVKAQKLKLYLKNYDNNSNGILLDGDERKEISSLVSYNPELKSSYTKLIAYEEKENRRKNFSWKYKEVRKLFDEKYLGKAKQKVTDLQTEYPDFNEVISLKKDIENKHKIADEKFKGINNYFQQGEIENGLSRLDEVLVLYKDMPEALKLKNKLEQNKKNDHILLVPERTGEKTIEIFCLDKVVLGRKDIDVEPDIVFEDRRISRPHLSISIVDDKLIAEDLNSSAGSFINGEKILSKSLNNNDLLNMAKTIDFRVFVQKQDGIVTGFILVGSEKDYIILTSKLEFGFDGKNLNGEKKNFSVVSENRVTFLLTEGNGILLENNLKISLGNKHYILEVL